MRTVDNITVGKDEVIIDATATTEKLATTVCGTDTTANKLTDNLIFSSLSSTFFVLIDFKISYYICLKTVRRLS